MVVPKSRGVGGSRAFVLLRCLKASPFLAILLYIIVIYSMNDGSDSLFDEGGGSGRSHQTHTSLQKQPHQPKSQRQQWQSKNSAVLAMATNMHIVTTNVSWVVYVLLGFRVLLSWVLVTMPLMKYEPTSLLNKS